MSDGRRTKLRESVHLPNLKLEAPPAESTPDKPGNPAGTFSSAGLR
jgi:hypothetical protein